MKNRNLKILPYAEVWRRGAAFVVDLGFIVLIGAPVIYRTNYLLALPIEYDPLSRGGHPIKMNEFVKTRFYELVILYSIIKLTLLVFYFAAFPVRGYKTTIFR